MMVENHTGTERRSIYSKRKRVKRRVLRTLGCWSRNDYDVEIVFDKGVATYKKITFKTCEQARQVSENLTNYGPTRHLPTLQARVARAIWVDFIHGQTCERLDDTLLKPLAECFGRFAQRRSQLRCLDETPYWARYRSNLDYLRRQRVVGDPLHRTLLACAHRARPATLRVGFDYVDPIGPNLLRRDDCGSICAIDVKNLRADTLVGEGLAKAADRWLCRDRRAFMFAHFERLGLADVERAFDFIRLYERAERVRRKVERDLRVHRRVRAHRDKRRRLMALLD